MEEDCLGVRLGKEEVQAAGAPKLTDRFCGQVAEYTDLGCAAPVEGPEAKGALENSALGKRTLAQAGSGKGVAASSELPCCSWPGSWVSLKT